MKLTDKISIRGQLRLQAFSPDGKQLFDTGFKKNQITELGVAEIVALAGAVGTPHAFADLALGDDNTAPTAGDTALGNEHSGNGLDRAAATITRQLTTFANDTLQFFHEWTTSAPATIEEVGVFNSADVMLARLLTGSRDVDTGTIVRATYQIIFTIS